MYIFYSRSLKFFSFSLTVFIANIDITAVQKKWNNHTAEEKKWHIIQYFICFIFFRLIFLLVALFNVYTFISIINVWTCLGATVFFHACFRSTLSVDRFKDTHLAWVLLFKELNRNCESLLQNASSDLSLVSSFERSIASLLSLSLIHSLRTVLPFNVFSIWLFETL